MTSGELKEQYQQVIESVQSWQKIKTIRRFIEEQAEPASNTGDNSDLDDGLLKATGLGMREGEIRAIAQIAAENELSAQCG